MRVVPDGIISEADGLILALLLGRHIWRWYIKSLCTTCSSDLAPPKSFIFTVITHIIHSHLTTPKPQGCWGGDSERFWRLHAWDHYQSTVMDYLNGQPVTVNVCPDISCKVLVPWWNIAAAWIVLPNWLSQCVHYNPILFLFACLSSYLASKVTCLFFLYLFWQW